MSGTCHNLSELEHHDSSEHCWVSSEDETEEDGDEDSMECDLDPDAFDSESEDCDSEDDFTCCADDFIAFPLQVTFASLELDKQWLVQWQPDASVLRMWNGSLPTLEEVWIVSVARYLHHTETLSIFVSIID